MSDDVHDEVLNGNGLFGAYIRESQELANALLAAIPELDEAAAATRDAIADWIGIVIHAPNAAAGVSLAAAQSVNEMMDLLVECVNGRGRPALKSCRSLFELMLTMKDVIADPVARERYEDHRWVIFQQVADLEGVRTPRRKGDAHHRKKIQRWVKPEYDRVISKYGSRFRLGWREETIAAAASRHGLAAEYEFYRLASGVLHGSSGGVIGQYVLDRIHGTPAPVYRTGAALALCPDAFERGTRYFRTMVLDTEAVVGTGGTADALLACSRLLQVAQTYRDYFQGLDEQWWETIPRGRLIATAGITTLGICRWFIHDINRNRIREALPPESLPPSQADALAEIVETRKAGLPIPGVDDSEVIAVAFPAIRLLPKPESSWRHAGELLQQPTLAVPGREGSMTIERQLEWLDRRRHRDE